MMPSRILSWIKPKEEKFQRLIGALAVQAHDGAIHLKTFAESQDAGKRAEASKAISAARLAAKTISAEIAKELCVTFITPFDREDIQNFSLDLYKITKTINKICGRMEMHGLVSEKGDFSRQIDLIVQEAAAMKDMVRELTEGRDTRSIVGKIELLQEIENKGDAILDDLLTNLFREDRAARELILRKDIYDMLEKIIDRYRDAAAVALQIVLKHR